MTSLAVRSVLPLLLSLFFSFLCFSTSEVFGEEQREFDYFLLALQWPGTICQRTHHCCPKNGCCQSSLPRTEFTIHGLWVNYNDGSWPACCSRPDFDIKKWEKHGTCSFPVIQDEYCYFSTALNLYFKYNMTKILTDAGYVPNNTNKYPLGDIVATIEDAFGASPLLVCKHGAVEELHICFYKDFKPRDCIIGSSTKDDMLGSRSSCPRYISLPEYSPLMLQDGNAAIPWLPDIEAL